MSEAQDIIEGLRSAAVIDARNRLLDRQQMLGKSNPWRFLCRALPHRWRFTHLFDDAPTFQFVNDRGGSNYAGVCPRCGARDLFRGPLREQGWKDFQEGNQLRTAEDTSPPSRHDRGGEG